MLLARPKSVRLAPERGSLASRKKYCELGSMPAKDPKLRPWRFSVRKFSPLIQMASTAPWPIPRPAAASASTRSTASRVLGIREVCRSTPSAANSGTATVSIQVFSSSLPPQWNQFTSPSAAARASTSSQESSPARKAWRKDSASASPSGWAWAVPNRRPMAISSVNNQTVFRMLFPFRIHARRGGGRSEQDSASCGISSRDGESYPVVMPTVSRHRGRPRDARAGAGRSPPPLGRSDGSNDP